MSDEDPFYSLPFDPDQMKPNHLKVVGSADDPLVLKAARLPDPTSIPPRAWLYGTQLLRGYVSVLVAPGGVGKTLYAMGIAVAVTSDRSIFGERIFARVNVAVVNLEDPMEELERRLAALMIHHGIDRAELQGRYFLYSADDRRITIAKFSPDGSEVIHPDEGPIIREIQAHEIGLLIVDPFAESHSLDENSNPQMVRAAASWRRIARLTGCAILLIHHVRKGAVVDIDSARGAKALTDSARVGLLLSPMSAEEATEFDVKDENRTRFVRLDDAKANMAKKAGVARWFQLETIELKNCTEQYPYGDRVAAIATWRPPSALGELTILQCNEALDAINKGPRTGVRYTGHKTGKDSSRWAGQVMIDLFGVSENRAAHIVGLWVKSGALEARQYRDGEQRKDRLGLFLVESRRPGNEIR